MVAIFWGNEWTSSIANSTRTESCLADSLPAEAVGLNMI